MGLCVLTSDGAHQLHRDDRMHGCPGECAWEQKAQLNKPTGTEGFLLRQIPTTEGLLSVPPLQLDSHCSVLTGSIADGSAATLGQKASNLFANMDPLTAMGIASNVIAFIDFGAGLLRGAVEIHNSLDGTLDDNKSRETVIREAERFYALLKISHEPTPPAGSFEHRSIYALAQECHAISARILTLLQNIKTKDARSKRQSLVSALRSKFYEKDREELEGRLANCRGQLDLQLSRLTG